MPRHDGELGGREPRGGGALSYSPCCTRAAAANISAGVLSWGELTAQALEAVDWDDAVQFRNLQCGHGRALVGAGGWGGH